MNRLLTVEQNQNVLETVHPWHVKLKTSYLFSGFQVLILQVRFPSTGKLYALHCSSLKSPDMDRWKPQKSHKPKLHASPFPEAFTLPSKETRKTVVSYRLRLKTQTAVSWGEENIFKRLCVSHSRAWGRVSRRSFRKSAVSVLRKTELSRENGRNPQREEPLTHHLHDRRSGLIPTALMTSFYSVLNHNRLNSRSFTTLYMHIQARIPLR